jgi:sugar phosphate isomerase/epimerase
MRRLLSTYLFSSQPLEAATITAASRLPIEAIELFSAPGHFNYRSTEHARELKGWLESRGLSLHSVHSPMERVCGKAGDGGAPISIAEPEKLRRIEAVDQVKWVLELAEQIPFRYLVQHVGSGREPLEGRYQDAAFNSLEYLLVFAKHRGITIALENTPGELSSPAALVDFLRATRLNDLALCFDVGHARLGDGIEAGFQLMRNRMVTTHIHDNHGEHDDHLVPFDGSIDWEAALTAFATAPADLPFVFELKEPAPGGREAVLDRAAAAFDRMEKMMAERMRRAGEN